VRDVFDPAYAERLDAVAPNEGVRRREPPALSTPPSIISEPCPLPSTE
jgi:hypothetical protein